MSDESRHIDGVVQWHVPASLSADVTALRLEIGARLIPPPRKFVAALEMFDRRLRAQSATRRAIVLAVVLFVLMLAG